MNGLWHSVTSFLNSGGLVIWILAVTSVIMWTIIFRMFAHYRLLLSRKTIIGRMEKAFALRRTGDEALDRKIADELVQASLLQLDRGLYTVGVLAAIAPLMGLLGTVVGMINTFDVITLHGTGNARALSAGISKALLTTQAGLLVAIPGMYMCGVLGRLGENLRQQAQSLGARLKQKAGHVQ